MGQRTADTSLTPSEREDKETDRRVRRQDPAPSRKHTKRRAPRNDLRKKRVRPDDPDLKPLKRRGKPDVATRPWVHDRLLNKFDRSVDSFFDDVDENEDWDEMMKRLDDTEEALEDDKGPGSAQHGKFEASGLGATSYGVRSAMAGRIATYHGVLDQRGNPTDPPNTGWKSLDKRYLSEEHFKSIVGHAKDLLDDEWFKFGWEGGAEDAPLRAALDLSIQVSDGGVYQSKIDAETYDMLLNRLAGWGHDTFSDTVVPMKASKTGDKRSASVMKSQEYQNIVRIANDLRAERPRTSLELLRNLIAMGGPETPMAPPAPEASASDDLGEIKFKSMSDDDFSKLKDDAKKLFDEKDVDAFLKGMEGFMGDVQKKTAGIGDSVLVPISLLMKLAASSQEAKAAFGHAILAAAKKKGKGKKAPPFVKKDDKAASKKKDAPDAKDGKPPFGGKKAPPFGGKKSKKKASIEASDLDW